jgi:hypothetical protein
MDEKNVQAILDKAVKALGGEDKLTKIEAAVWKGKGKIIIGDNQEHEFTSQTIAQGFDRFRSELDYPGTCIGNSLSNVTYASTLKSRAH